jgi:hypothetical protein
VLSTSPMPTPVKHFFVTAVPSLCNERWKGNPIFQKAKHPSMCCSYLPAIQSWTVHGRVSWQNGLKGIDPECDSNNVQKELIGIFKQGPLGRRRETLEAIFWPEARRTVPRR